VAFSTEAGVEAVDDDLKDPSSLRAACEGVRTVVTTANAAQRGGEDTFETVDRLGNAALIDAAAEAGGERFVFAPRCPQTRPVPCRCSPPRGRPRSGSRPAP
jgi:uncharacterized protein YbjT (DUF2867 family)